MPHPTHKGGERRKLRLWLVMAGGFTLFARDGLTALD
jgi:hypothetical protein